MASRLDRLAFWTGLILLLAVFSASATSSAWFTRVWQIEDGLPDNDINAMVQGPDDYLWLVTPVGLIQFDGDSFSPFPIENYTGRAASHVRLLLRGQTGVLWMASDGGTVLGLKPDFSPIHIPKKDLPNHVPEALAEDGGGSLWLGYAGAAWAGYSDGIFRLEKGQVRRFDAGDGVPSGFLHSMTSDGAGNIWLAKTNQILFFLGGHFRQAASLSGVQCLAATCTNAVWFTTASHLFDCDMAGRLRDCGAFQSPSDATTTVLLEDHMGAVWIGTDGDGLFRYDESGFERITTSHSSILSLTEDREGNLWAGTAGGGLDRVSLSGVSLEVMQNHQLPLQIQSICQDTQGTLWGATQNGALVSRVTGQWRMAFTNAPFAGAATCVAAGRDGAVWIGTRNGNLLRLVNATVTTRGTNVINGPISALLPVSQGDLWIVSGNMLRRWHDGQSQTVNLPRQIHRISAITEDASGHVWIGANGILLSFNDRGLVNETPRLRISDRPISCLCATPDGSVWIGCRGGELLRFKDGKVGRIGTEQGLLNNYLSQIVADGQGWLWFGSERGVFKIRQRELEQAMEDHSLRLRPVVYGRNEGFASLEAVFSTAQPYVLPRALLADDGRVWLLMHTGVVVADPGRLPDNSAPPPVLLTQVAMDGQIIATHGGIATTQLVANLSNLGAPLRLPPEHRHLEFDFTAFHFSAPENIRFRYQLEGYDNGWIDAGTERHADYSRLPAGDYQFRVAAGNGDGPWNEAPATLGFSVTPFFWQTWWFCCGLLLLFTSSVIAIVRYLSFRRLRRRLRAVEQQAAIERERGRIARDIHDDLGNRLTKIQLLSGLAQRDRTNPDKATAHVRQISSAARQATDALDEIIWAINPRNDTLPHLINYIGQFAVEFLRPAGLRCRVDLPDHPPEKLVSAEVRHNLFLVTKESLNNIVRHAQATEVSLMILVANESISVVIEDNGRGFNEEARRDEANGLGNMRQRMMEIGGEFQIKTTPGAGTRVSLNGSWLARQ